MKKKIIYAVILVLIAIFIIVYNTINSNEEIYNYENLIVENISNNVENTVQEIKKIKVYVTGAVNSPGVIELEEGSRICDAIELAGRNNFRGKFRRCKFGICFARWTKIIYSK